MKVKNSFKYLEVSKCRFSNGGPSVFIHTSMHLIFHGLLTLVKQGIIATKFPSCQRSRCNRMMARGNSPTPYKKH